MHNVHNTYYDRRSQSGVYICHATTLCKTAERIGVLCSVKTKGFRSKAHCIRLGSWSPTTWVENIRCGLCQITLATYFHIYFVVNVNAVGVRCLQVAFFVYQVTIVGDSLLTAGDHNGQRQLRHAASQSVVSLLVYRPDKQRQLWRFLLYMLVHAGWLFHTLWLRLWLRLMC